MRPNLITRLKEEWNNIDPVDPLRGLIADAIDALAEAGNPASEQPAQQSHCNDCGGFDPECPLAQLAQQELVPVTDNTYGYAKNLAETIFKQHFASDEHYASGRIVWGVNDTVIGILTQIDNMVADMVRKPAQQEPVGKVNELFDEAVIEQCGFDRELLVYTSPPNVPMARASKPWVGLTPNEKKEIERLSVYVEGAIRHTEAKLKEKNNG